MGKGDECTKKFLSYPKLEEEFKLYWIDNADGELIGDVGERIMSLLYAGNSETPIKKIDVSIVTKRHHFRITSTYFGCSETTFISYLSLSLYLERCGLQSTRLGLEIV